MRCLASRLRCSRLVSPHTWLTVAIIPQWKLVVLYEDLPSDVISDHVVPIPEKSHRVAPGLLPLDHHRLLVRTASSSGTRWV